MIPLSIADPLSGAGVLDRKNLSAEVYTWRDPVLGAGGLLDLLDPSNDQYRNLLNSATTIAANKIYFGIRLFSNKLTASPSVESALIRRVYLERTESGTDVPVTVVQNTTSVTRVTFDKSFLPEPGVKPKVSVIIENLDGHIVWYISTVTAEYFEVTTQNCSITDNDATMDWIAEGYGEFE